MNLAKNSKCLAAKSKWLNRLVHQKKSLPPLTKTTADADEVVPGRGERLTKEMFGATILPQNLSFENAKKLSENQVRLEDIPLVDENEAAEVLVAEKIRGRKAEVQRQAEESKREEEDPGVVVLETDLMKRPRELKKSLAEMFWVADPYEDIPGPRLLRNVATAFRNFTRQLTVVSLFRYWKANALAAFRAYGPVVKLPEILGGKIVLISRPEHISAVFEQDQRFPVNSTLDSVQRCRLQRKVKRSRQPSPHLTEEEWEGLRRSLPEALVKEPERYFDAMDEAASKFVRRIRSLRNRQNEVPDDFLFEINRWSLECLCSVIFDRSFGFLDHEMTGSWSSKSSQLLYSLTVATKNLCHLETGFQLWRFMNTYSLSSLGTACDVLEGLISEYVSQVQMGLVKRKGQEKAGTVALIEGLLLKDHLTPDEIIGNILDTLLIGMNTMSTALGFLLYHLSQNPRAQEGVLAEVQKILPEKYSRLEHEQLHSLRYLQACLKESLRLKMPMPVLTRVLSNNVIISNYQIPKGTFVLMTAQAEGMKEEYFEDPGEFLPERWLDQDVNHLFASLPMRNCFEDSFERRIGEAAIWVCASQIVRQFSVDYLYGDIEATDTTISFPNKPFRFTFVDRKE